MRKDARFIFFALLALLLLGFGALMRDFWKPAGLALVTVMVLKPIHVWLERRLRGHRYVTGVIAVAATCLLIMLPLGAILTTITVEVVHFSQAAGDHLHQGNLAQSLDSLNTWLREFIAPYAADVAQELDLRALLVNGLREFAQGLYQFSPRVAAKTANFGLAVGMWLLFLFVFFAEGERLYRYLAEISPVAPAHERHISRGVREMVSAVCAGMVATSVVNAVLMGIAFAVCGIDRPLVWALITFGFSFIPVVGAFSIWCGAAIYLLAVGAWPYAAGLALFGVIIIAQTDNVVKPLVMRGRVKVHPVLLLLSILSGVKALGPVGLVFGPVFVAILLEALEIYRTEYAGRV